MVPLVIFCPNPPISVLAPIPIGVLVKAPPTTPPAPFITLPKILSPSSHHLFPRSLAIFKIFITKIPFIIKIPNIA
jgi:hypothetical protein